MALASPNTLSTISHLIYPLAISSSRNKPVDRATNLSVDTFRLTRDADPPQVWLTVPRRVYTRSILLIWGASDERSDVAYYDLDVQVEDGAWQPFSTACAGDEVGVNADGRFAQLEHHQPYPGGGATLQGRHARSGQATALE